MTDKKKPPDIHASAAEQALLGALLATPGLWDTIIGKIAADDFYDPRNALIFATASKVAADGYKPDWAMVMSELERTDQKRGAGGDDYLADLAGIAGSVINVPGYVEQIVNSATARKIYKAASEVASAAKRGDQPANALALQASLTMQKIAEHQRQDEFTTHKDALAEWRKRLETKDQIPTGIRELTAALLGGLHRGFLVVLGGIQGSGKTTLAMQWANRADNALVFAMDTSPMLCAEIVGNNPRAEILYSNTPSNILQLANLAISWNAGIPKENKRLIVVDYLQILSSGEKTNSTADDIQARMKTLRYLARVTNAAVLVCSAVSRPMKTMGKPPPPTIDNLKGSSSIEFDADIAMILWQKNPPDPNEPEPTGEPRRRELSVVKNRISEEKKRITLWLTPDRRFFDSPDKRLAPSPAKTEEALTATAENADGFDPDDTRIEQMITCKSSDEFLQRVAQKEKQGWTLVRQGGGGAAGDFYAVMRSPR